MIVQKDAAFHCVVELGRQGVVQFKDLNQHLGLFQRTFVREVRRCTELERCIRYIEEEINDAGADKHIPPLDSTNTEVIQQREIYDLETKLYELERDLRQFLANEEQIKQNYNDMREFQCVLQKVESFFNVHLEDMAKTELDAEGLDDKVNDLGTPLTPLLERNHETPWFIAGILEAQKRHSFERVLWRACRRTAFVRTAEIDDMFEDPHTGKLYAKSVFIIFFNGQKLQDIVNRVCDGFNAKLYSCPKSSKERRLVEADVTLRLHDLRVVIEETEKQKFILLSTAASQLPEWARTVHLQKCVYHALNLFTFDTSGNFFVAECWLPERELDAVFQTLQRGVDKAGSSIRPIINVVENSETPPTFNRTNKFTRVFQNIVDSYGVASYREVNPAPFTIITFPFLFGIMFGDFGHGLIMALAGLTFIYFEKRINAAKIKDEIFNTFYDGRFIIILMGVFSMYAGIIYNDVFAKSVNIFGSRWEPPGYDQYVIGNMTKLELANKIEVDPKDAFKKVYGPYPIGVDPVWILANNRLNFLNSMKMKASVVIGITQMTFGVILSFMNAAFFKSKVDIFTQCIPQLIFLSSIFIYLCGQIFAKWIFFWVEPARVFSLYYPGSHCAPSLLVGLINMFMFKQRAVGFTDSEGNEIKNCHLSYWYPNQKELEHTLVIVALLMIPIMLFGKPLFWLLSRKKNQKRRVETRRPTNVSVRIKMGAGEEAELISELPETPKIRHKSESMSARSEHEQKEFGDVMVHQSIHTIEFVLGCISHTASYLRLWALSLAHAQLSEVLWEFVLHKGLSVDHGVLGAAVLAVMWFIFFLLTVAVLVLMEGLSAFLHALRLHWVEFQSKFYEGAGSPFQPLYFKASLRKLCAESLYY
ncbi:unnamed protein product [Bursaphelenchus okinawaensis]|uniref:V-type proton ATPase subunit a n=1 Tax=Bursaphelenchus okinawaensis TaxID=465554 RepID=A0A811KU38_9BILA|nr:unnamed protein product [Bursaphelenchus okinawaensis]CAG9112225.1 unnamed protein product [Bursaphelenchus okinawaensis]